MSLLSGVSLVERCAFCLLHAFWLAGALLLLVELPRNCKFFSLPTEGEITAENPHSTPVADGWYNFTHVMTLTSYAGLCCFLQLLLFVAWSAQMAFHSHLMARQQRETARRAADHDAGKGVWNTLVMICDEDDEITAGSAREHRGGLRCVCGCCYCFSTSCSLIVFNVGVVALLCYFLIIGTGSLESAGRFNQNHECRRAQAAGWYIYALNAALLVLYGVLLIMHCICSAREVASDVARQVRDKVRPRAGGSKYAQVGGAGQAESQFEIELELDADAELDADLSADQDRLGMDNFLEDGDDGEEPSFTADGLQSAQHIAQPKPHRPASKILAPASSNGHGSASPKSAADEFDEDDLDALEMSQAPVQPQQPRRGASGSSSPKDTTADSQRAI